jgi:hypothetical protein
MSIEPEEEIIGRTTNYFKLFMYVITKLVCFFIAYTKVIGLFAFTIATVYAYVEFVFDDKTFK